MNTRNKSVDELLGPTSIGEYLELLRDDKEIESKVEWAGMLGLSKQQYNNIVNSGAPVSLEKCLNLVRSVGESERVMINVWMNDQLRRNDLPQYEVQVMVSNV